MKQETKSFTSYGIAESGLIFDNSDHRWYPIKYYNVVNGNGVTPINGFSYFVFVYEGEAYLHIKNNVSATLPKDTYFSHYGYFQLFGKFKAIVIEVIDGSLYRATNYKAQTLIGGVVERTGRLRYIDGCSDSLLIPPVRKGDPCLNHLHFPPHTIQTPHTHPSHRIGIVIRGSGECITPFGNLPLVEGCIFVIKEYNGEEKAIGLDGNMYEAGTHKFDTTDSFMDVIAFHPDSDFGPEDTCHPMINRTIVEGVSANAIKEIQTNNCN
jgi:hypothetical protein